MPATPLPEYRCYLPVLVFPDQGLDCYVLECSRVILYKISGTFFISNQ
jgi:hypothetical protein